MTVKTGSGLLTEMYNIVFSFCLKFQVRLVSVGLLLAAISCSPIYAPPPRVAFGRMPAVHEPHQSSIHAAGGIYNTAELRINIGLGPRWELDVGGAGGKLTSPERFMLGGVGLRYEITDKGRFHMACEGGGAIGCGGENEGQGQCEKQNAVAGYAGPLFGIELIQPTLGLYLGNRYMLSYAEGLPYTHWGHHVLGLQLQGTHLFGSVEAGVAYYRNSADKIGGVTGSLAAGYRWGPGL